MDKKFPPLLPRSAGEFENKISSQTRQKRRQVVAACENCRKRKEKCDDKRPTCGACARRGVYCNNGTKDDEPSSALTLRSRNALLRQENKQLRELFMLLRKMCEGDTYEVLGRLRDTDDPFSVLRDVQQAPLEPKLSRSPPEESLDDQVEKIDLVALRESPFRLEAKPWTAIVGDGLVSDLISSYFIWDNSFLTPFIEQDAFLSDMRSQNPENSKYCSAFLVNAICASRCVSYSAGLFSPLLTSFSCSTHPRRPSLSAR